MCALLRQIPKGEAETQTKQIKITLNQLIMKTKLTKATDCINNESSICSELTVFPHSGSNKDVIVLSIDDRTGGGGILLSPESAKAFAEGILKQVAYYKAHEAIDIPTDSDVTMSIQLARVTCNGHALPDEVCLSLTNGASEEEMVSVLTVRQTRTLVAALQRLIGE